MVSQVGPDVRHVAAVGALVLPRLLVCRLYVALQGARDGEGSPALAAYVGPLLGVLPHVDGQRVAVHVARSTLGTHVRLLSCVGTHVLL